MRLIAMSQYGQLEKGARPLLYYKNAVESLLTSIAPYAPNWQHELLTPNDVLNTSPLIIVISSSKGLCGGFNYNLIKFFQRFCFIEEHQKPYFITVGHKAAALINEQYPQSTIAHYDSFGVQNLPTIANAIMQNILDTNFSSITIFSNFFRNFFLQQPQKTNLAPLDLSVLTENPSGISSQAIVQNFDDLIWEQSPEHILDHLANMYLKTSIHTILYQSLLSEQAARFIAMDNATSNAEKMLDKLTLDYNKSRQALITKELAELTANFS